MRHFTTRHLWLQRRDDQIVVSNVCSKRRALLDPTELEHLERFSEGAEAGDDELTRRLIEADLILPEGAPAAESPRLTTVLFAMDKFLAEQRGKGRSQVQRETPDPLQRLEMLREVICSRLQTTAPRVEGWKRRSAVDDFQALIDHVRTFLTTDAYDPGPFSFPPGYLSSTAGRPLPRYDYEQQPCMPATTVARVRSAVSRLSDGSRGLILGDDDLIGLYWSREVPRPADIFELDTELISFLEPQLREGVGVRQRDLTNGLPEEFRGLYDVVFTDPMYRADGMDLFMECAASGLSPSPDARVYFSTQPALIQEGKRFEERLAEAGLVIESRHPDFSRYAMPDFARKLILRDFMGWQAPIGLIDGLLQIPYLYADLFVLKRA